MYPNLDDIEFTESVKQSVKMSINNGNNIVFNTPRIYIPFGLQKYYNSWTLNFQLRDLKTDTKVNDFYTFIKEFETHLIEKINISDTEFNSQISEANPKYDPIIYSKILEQNNKILCEVIDSRDNSNEFINIYEFPKKVYAKLYLSLDKIWKINDMYTYKIKVKKIEIID